MLRLLQVLLVDDSVLVVEVVDLVEEGRLVVWIRQVEGLGFVVADWVCL